MNERSEHAGGHDVTGYDVAGAATTVPSRADGDPWAQYLAAARRLDAVRAGAATAADEQAQAVQMAREELSGVRARLVAQQSRLRALGVPDSELQPEPAEVEAAAAALRGRPDAVLAALRQAGVTADAAEAAAARVGTIDTGTRTRPRWWPARLPMLPRRFRSG